MSAQHQYDDVSLMVPHGDVFTHKACRAEAGRAAAKRRRDKAAV